ncbi:MAG: DNA primase [Gammaproteobacteria bacterium]|nr:DNA primase [Gammaproteobacteria bacterium]
MSAADALLARLDRVRPAGDGRWMARCPAHEDRGPSLSIRELDDGRLLVHDFGGCAAADVLAAVGLEFSDLYPDRPKDHRAAGVRPNHWHAAREALASLAPDALLVAIAAETLAGGVPLTRPDRDRLTKASGRIRRAVGMVQR